MAKRVIQRKVAVFRVRPERQLQALDDWVLAMLGVISFVIAGYWGIVVANFLPDLLNQTNQHGLTFVRTAIFVCLGVMGVCIWFFGCLATRCHSLLYERHFR